MTRPASAPGTAPGDGPSAAGEGGVTALDLLVIGGLFVVATTEGLGWAGAFRFPALAAAWGVAVAALAVFLLSARAAVGRAFARAAEDARGADPLWLAVLGILLVAGVIAVAAPPTNFDSMTYHMARVAHWVQDGTVAHYFTPNGRQLHSGPFAEFVVAQLQILARGDRLANAAQWIAFAGCAAGAAAVAGRLGAGRRGRALAAVAAVTVPMAILQASSNQTDLVASCWALVVVWNVLTFMGPSPGLLRAAALGGSLGLGLLTKATLILVLAPFLLWLLLDTVRRRSGRRIGLLAVAGLLALAVNLPAAVRNVELFGAPLGPMGHMAYHRNQLLTPRGAASNVLRGAAVHLGIPVPAIRHAIEDAFVAAHGLLGVDASDPRTTLAGTRFFIPSLSADENVAGNPIHLGLAAVALPGLLAGVAAGKRFRYALALLSAALLFAAFLKWQPWISRLQLPLFALSAPAVAAWADEPSRRRWIPALGWLLAVSSLPFLFLNSERPLIRRRGLSVFGSSRTELMFANIPDVRAQFETIAAACRKGGVRSLGLVIGSNSWEYPYWALLAGREGPVREIRHLPFPEAGMEEVPAERRGRLMAMSGEGFAPDAIVRDGDGLPAWSGAEIRYRGTVYVARESAGPLRLFVRERGREPDAIRLR